MCACYVLCVKYEYVHGSVRGKCVYVYMSICVVCVCVCYVDMVMACLLTHSMFVQMSVCVYEVDVCVHGTSAHECVYVCSVWM